MTRQISPEPLDPPVDSQSPVIVADLAAPSGSWFTVALLWFGVFSYMTMEMMVAPIVPIVQHELGMSPAVAAWMLTGLMVVGAVSLPLSTRYADIADKKKVFFVILGVSGVGAVLAAVAPSASLLIAGNMLQGVGIAVVPIAIGIARDSQPLARAKFATTAFVVAGGAGSAVAYVAVGPIVKHLHYSYIYWIPTAVILAVIVLGAKGLPACPPVRTGRVDWLGAALLAVALTSFLLGLTLASTEGWGSAIVLGLLILTVALATVFVVVERRVDSPLVDLRGIAEREVAGVMGLSLLRAACAYTMYLVLPTVALLPLATGYGMGGDASTAGLVLLPYALVILVAGPTASRLEPVLGRRGVMVLSGVLMTLGAVPLLFIGSAPWTPYLTAAILGAGIAMSLTQGLNTIVQVVPNDRVASTSGTTYVLQSVGGVTGGQIAAGILAVGMVAGGAPTWGGFLGNVVLLLALGLAAIGLSFTLKTKRAAASTGRDTDPVSAPA